MKFAKLFVCIFSVIAFCVPALAQSAASRVVVVANSADPDSVEVAEHYMRSRGIPEKNLIAFPMPTAETLTWKIFAETVHTPLLRELVKRGLIDGKVSDEKDRVGRNVLLLPATLKTGSAKAAEAISYLVLCRGVPLRIQNETAFQPALPPSEDGNVAPKYGPLQVNNASVDSELALIALPGTEINGFIQNPFFRNAKDTPLKSFFIKVARLDGPTPADAKSLVDNAIKAEKNGLLGRAYFDLGGPHKEGDKWLEETAGTAKKLGFDVSIERTKKLMGVMSRYDAPAFYFGWYSEKVAGFFSDPSFRFPAGACAIHIHSFSATTMRDASVWAPGFVARGVSATVGNVYEPYLGLTHYPHYFMEAIASGMSVGDAAAFSLPAFSWQAIFVGDPLYTPLRKSLDEQIAESRERPGRLTQYAYIRAANLALASGDVAKVHQIERDGMMFSPGLALAFSIAERGVVASGGNAKWSFNPSYMSAENSGLLLDVVRFLAKRGNAKKAVEWYREILARNLVSSNARLAVLNEAVKTAQVYGVASAPVSAWQDEILEFSRKSKK